MAHHGHQHGRGQPMDWDEDQGNGFRGQSGRRMGNQGGSAAWDRGEYGGQGSYEGQGEYGNEGWWAQGEFPGQGRTQYQPQGYGEDYTGQGIGWQGGERYARGPEAHRHPPSQGGPRHGAGGYGQTYARMPEGQGYGGQRDWQGGRGGWREDSPRGPWDSRTRGQGYGGWEQQSGDQGFWDEGRSGQWGGSRGRDFGVHRQEDWLTPGPHSGRGPRGYRRSDARIEEDVYERLTHHGMLDATDIEVRVEGGVVTLSGTVESRQAKRIAEDILESISGVTDIANQLRVQGQGGPGQSSQRVLNDERQLGGAGQGQHQDQPQAGAELLTQHRNRRGQTAKAGAS